MGGGTAVCEDAGVEGVGPSPRGRGNRPAPDGVLKAERTIPAWAGEPTCLSMSMAVTRDHPRVGGGTGGSMSRTRFALGPSPRGRGNHLMTMFGPPSDRTIPAWAGEQFLFMVVIGIIGDHPRVGGGTDCPPFREPARMGPSPRGRGNRIARRRRQPRRRTIPAWAGEPRHGHGKVDEAADHPRVGGGTLRGTPERVRFNGPSPRGRGNPRTPSLLRQCRGTIPAWAGEPSATNTHRADTRDHPRVGGGTTMISDDDASDAGPSPRGRGNRADKAGNSALSWTIPAWAGEPASSMPMRATTWDHPRVGGGTAVEDA